jgi:hypothetical protein
MVSQYASCDDHAGVPPVNSRYAALSKYSGRRRLAGAHISRNPGR